MSRTKNNADTRRKALVDFEGEELIIAEKTITVRQLLAWASSVGVDLDGVDLSDMRSTHSNLTYLHAPRARIYGSDFRHSKFCRSIFHQANLSDSDFSGSDFRGSYLNESKSMNADFSGCDMRGAYLLDGDFTGANFSKADMRGCKIEDAVFVGADFRGANIEGLDLLECEMDFAKLSLLEKSHIFRLT